MKKVYLVFLVILIVAVGGVYLLISLITRTNPKNNNQTQPVNSDSQTVQNTADNNRVSVNQPVNQAVSPFQPPLTKSGERITKKPFGIHITLQNSPVQPERFQGYHTGADFEIFPDELTADVAVKAVCSGVLKVKEYASGYGGVAVETCQLNNEPITVIYGHLKLASIQYKAGDSINVGDQLGLLGADKSVETDGERKHLHLGFHKGSAINLLGYVNTQAGLADWIDPCLYICHD
ncbi:MAG: M23 family metallopeptidase [Patescibacteria group bacterium]|nr:M23 family metallopeptidase [Patescibacteria group bacterium]